MLLNPPELPENDYQEPAIRLGEVLAHWIIREQLTYWIAQFRYDRQMVEWFKRVAEIRRLSGDHEGCDIFSELAEQQEIVVELDRQKIENIKKGFQ